MERTDSIPHLWPLDSYERSVNSSSPTENGPPPQYVDSMSGMVKPPILVTVPPKSSSSPQGGCPRCSGVEPLTLQGFTSLSIPSRRIFTVDCMPQRAWWSTQQTEYQQALGGEQINTPYTVWVVGYAQAISFFASTGAPLPSVSISVIPLHHVDWVTSATLMSCINPSNRHFNESPGIITATSRLQDPAPDGKEPTEFSEVYDARTGYRHDKCMPYYPVDKLSLHDTILVELFIVRSVQRTPMGDRTWRVGYELQQVSLLANAADA
ncbi:hypothetical protein BV25DRAFT_1918184 [Artomyces pyxidatus]|uniref:Uncharacterized protein n=1 Tax=Artomyces pyxidatus TaxID=48021 RepID=A0ACB8STN1_9AGAM|nr:hypothetical protein BV25DRAFT_1918184 [Artomyces pyxidatus]